MNVGCRPVRSASASWVRPLHAGLRRGDDDHGANELDDVQHIVHIDDDYLRHYVLDHIDDVRAAVWAGHRARVSGPIVRGVGKLGVR
jgi:hypothetical protein